MKKCIYKGTLKSVYVDKDKAEKVFALSYSKSDVLYEALNTARVADYSSHYLPHSISYISYRISYQKSPYRLQKRT